MPRNWRSVLVASAALAAVSAPAAAEGFKGKQAGDLLLRARGLTAVVDADADIRGAAGDTGLDAKVSNSTVPELDLTYFVTGNLAVEAIAGTTRHDVGVRQLGADLGSVRLLPPTVTLQYHFAPESRFSPYVGAGLNWTLFYGAKPGQFADVKYENSFGVAAQAGFDYFVTDNWLVNVDVKKIWLDTDVKVNGGTLRADANLNPWLFGVGLGYKF